MGVIIKGQHVIFWGFPGDSDGKKSAYKAGDLGLIHGSGRSPGEGNGRPLQYSCLENPREAGAWWAAIYGVARSQTRLTRLSSSSSSSSTLRHPDYRAPSSEMYL